MNFNSTHERLVDILESIDRTGNPCVSGRMEAPPPRVAVASVGPIEVPVPESQILELIAVSEQAPYGRGTETILARSVRD